MLVVLGVADIILNWTHIHEAKLDAGSPLLAAAYAGGIAAAIGWAGHLIGTVIKQFNYFFGKHNAESRLGEGLTTLTSGLVVLSVAMVA